MPIRPPSRSDAVVQRVTGSGEVVWTSVFEGSFEYRLDGTYAAAWHPDFVVAVGGESISSEQYNVRRTVVRRFAVE